MAAKDNDDRKDDQDGDISLDMSQAAVKKMIADARERGYITYDQLNAVLPPEQVSSDQIEDVMSMLSEMGIQVTEEENPKRPTIQKAAPLLPLSRALVILSLVVRMLKSWTAPMTLFACTCAKWALLSCCRVKAKLRLPSASRLAAIR